MPIQTTSGPSILTDDTLDECSMKRNGKPCGSSNVVPVLHAGMIGQPHGGNPYRRYCLDCEKMGHAISKKAFKRHTHPKVLPRDAEDTDPDVATD